ncbi:MAG: hypothetical protein L0H31_09365 [Nocardioidaceae bacterium]|nr:hypothetical protein [Nocardioidaceae bacterium]
MSANLYDMLDVDPSATGDEIRAAWKSAIADLDPTERRFRAYNDAAGELLDPERRAAYDATLAADREAAEDEAAEGEAAEEENEPEAEPDEDEPAEVSPGSARLHAGPTGRVLIGVGIAAVLAVGLVVWLLTLDGVKADQSPRELAQSSGQQDRAALSAESAAEKLVGPVFSYNYKTMDADLERIRSHQTEQMAKTQAAGWPQLTDEAKSQQVVVQAASVGSALTRVSDDGSRAIVVVFIDQKVKKKATDPFTLKMWATLDMVRASGESEKWLIDDVCTDSTQCKASSPK